MAPLPGHDLYLGPYPASYFTLPGVTPIQAPPELWWSSRERKVFEDGLPTSEYLEFDFGRLRSLNFLNFNILQKPIDITVEYDVWGYDTGIKFWQPVTPVPNERFDNRVNYAPNSTNPWQNCQFYYTNVKGDLISARYMRIKFDRRDEPWPNGDVAGTFPWSIDVKDLRTSRYVINLNDTRGIAINQGRVVHTVVDPVKFVDSGTVILDATASAVEAFAGVDAATVTLVGVVGNSNSDEGTASVIGVPSALEAYGSTDAATVTTVGVPSAVEVFTPYWTVAGIQMINSGAEVDLDGWFVTGGTFTRTTGPGQFTTGVAGFRLSDVGGSRVAVSPGTWTGLFVPGRKYKIVWDMRFDVVPSPPTGVIGSVEVDGNTMAQQISIVTPNAGWQYPSLEWTATNNHSASLKLSPSNVSDWALYWDNIVLWEHL